MSGAAPPTGGEAVVPAAAVRELVRQLHTTASQEAAAARIALAVWRRATAKGDTTTANLAVSEAEARLEALFDGLASLEASGKAILADATAIAPAP